MTRGEIADKLRLVGSALRTDVDSVIHNVSNDVLDDGYETFVRLAEFDRTGKSFDAGTVLAEFQAR